MPPIKACRRLPPRLIWPVATAVGAATETGVGAPIGAATDPCLSAWRRGVASVVAPPTVWLARRQPAGCRDRRSPAHATLLFASDNCPAPGYPSVTPLRNTASSTLVQKNVVGLHRRWNFCHGVPQSAVNPLGCASGLADVCGHNLSSDKNSSLKSG